MNAFTIALDALPSVVFKDCRSLPDVPAVYVLINDGQPIYVGRSKNPRQRLQTHNQRHYLNPSTVVAWFEADADKLRDVEALFIERFHPVLNVVEPELRGEFTLPAEPHEDILRYTCSICGHLWMPRKENPAVCPNPKCHSANWDKPKPKGKK